MIGVRFAYFINKWIKMNTAKLTLTQTTFFYTTRRVLTGCTMLFNYPENLKRIYWYNWYTTTFKFRDENKSSRAEHHSESLRLQYSSFSTQGAVFISFPLVPNAVCGNKDTKRQRDCIEWKNATLPTSKRWRRLHTCMQKWVTNEGRKNYQNRTKRLN